MPLAHVKFWEEPREFAEHEIEELRSLGLLRDDPPAAPKLPAPAEVKPKD